MSASSIKNNKKLELIIDLDHDQKALLQAQNKGLEQVSEANEESQTEEELVKNEESQESEVDQDQNSL